MRAGDEVVIAERGTPMSDGDAAPAPARQHSPSSRKSSEGDKIARRLGENLRRVRNQLPMSQAELAAAAALHRTEVGLIERGHRVSRIDTLIKIAAALGVSPLVLLDGISWTIGGPSSGRFTVEGSQSGASPDARDRAKGDR